MEIGLGVLHLAPDDFWNMSLPEFYSACDGLKEFNSTGEEPQAPLTRDELNELMELNPD